MAEQKNNPSEKSPRNMMMILQISFAVVNLLVAGLGLYLVYASTIGWNSPAIEEEQLASMSDAEEAKGTAAHGESGGDGHGGGGVSSGEPGPLIYTMDKFTVNLDGEPKRTIRLEVNLEMLGKDGFEEIINTDNRAKARDRIVRLLNEKTFSDLESIQGKLFLKDRIAMDINGILDKGVVKDVYFSEFVVQ